MDQQQRMEWLLELMQQTETDLIGVIEHTILETQISNLKDTTILGWFPPTFIEEAIRWLEAEAEEIMHDPEP